jgi:hypothetical protein
LPFPNLQPVDAVYEAFGKVLTISGRTIREDAQRSPAIVKQAQDALEGLLAEVGGLCVWGRGGGGLAFVCVWRGMGSALERWLVGMCGNEAAGPGRQQGGGQMH